jgi:hypothetical protein
MLTQVDFTEGHDNLSTLATDLICHHAHLLCIVYISKPNKTLLLIRMCTFVL